MQNSFPGLVEPQRHFLHVPFLIFLKLDLKAGFRQKEAAPEVPELLPLCGAPEKLGDAISYARPETNAG